MNSSTKERKKGFHKAHEVSSVCRRKWEIFLETREENNAQHELQNPAEKREHARASGKSSIGRSRSEMASTTAGSVIQQEGKGVFIGDENALNYPPRKERKRKLEKKQGTRSQKRIPSSPIYDSGPA